MRGRIVVSLLLFATVAVAGPRRRAVGAPADPSLTFTFDSGFRIESATNPMPGIDPMTGETWLYYADNRNNKQMVATSADGLTFRTPGEARNSWKNDPRNSRMPNGTWRRYGWNLQALQFTSSVSSDGATFTQEPGIRYTLQARDNGTMGIYEAFADTQGGVVLLYIGDMFGLNNVRRAYSRDGGLTFTYDRGNILGDDSAGGAANSYVDQKALRLPDGRIRLFTMKQNAIYSFISNDDGYSFQLEPGARLDRSSFTGATLRTLNDPVVVRLADGRYRMYVASLRSDNVWVIVSATSR
jgi:hypothetical protein